MTEFLARFSARRPLLVLTLWAVLTLVAGAISIKLLDSATTTELKLTGGAESEIAGRLLEERLRGPEPLIELVVVQSDAVTVDDPEFEAKVQSVFESIVSLGGGAVTAGRSYYQEDDESLVSADRSATIIRVVLAGTLDEAEENVRHIIEIVEEADAGEGFRVLVGGTASINFENAELAQEDLEQGERVGIPVALIILLVLFGAVGAALVPLALAIGAIIVALGIASLIGQVFELNLFITLMITMIGLAVGIDYSLLIVSRFREELDRGLSKEDAAVRAGATAGRTVLFSGLTVVIALCGMLLVPASFFQSLGVGAIIVVLVSLAATLTNLPAALALLGHRVDFLSLPFLSRGRAASAEASGRGFWEVITRVVTKFPAISIIVVAAPMIAATYFYFEIETGLSGVDSFPEGAQTREAFFVLEEKFSFGLVNPMEIVIDGDVEDPQVQEAIGNLEASLNDDPRFPFPPALAVNPAGDLALLTLAVHGEPRSQEAVDILGDIRERYIASAFDGVPATVYVGGATAEAADVFDIFGTYTPIVFVFVLGCSFIILMLVFRSIVIPVKAVVMNLLSVGTAYGLLVLVFQKGYGAEFLGFQQVEVIDTWIPLFLFSILFGLSMDYHVFLLSRIRERYDQTGDNNGSVAYGLRATAGMITGAALIMVAVFGGFAMGETVINQQVGFGLAVAVLLDATLVRSVLVPATMDLLGRGNWYLPGALRWLPDLRVEPTDERPA